MPLLDLRQFTTGLAARRNRAALLLTPDLCEQRACAAQLAAAIGVAHLDLLDRFQADVGLSDRLTSFSMTDFFAFMADQRAERLLIVSGIEFLLAEWLCQGEPKQVKRDFCGRIEMWDDRSTAAFLLVAQHDPVFAGYQPTRYRGSQIVIQLSQTLALS